MLKYSKSPRELHRKLPLTRFKKKCNGPKYYPELWSTPFQNPGRYPELYGRRKEKGRTILCLV